MVQFKKDKNDKVTFIVHRRSGSTLVRLHQSDVQLTQKSENTVSVEITDADKNPRVLFYLKKKFDVLVPNDYSIEFDEPRFGKLIYEAKVGLVGKWPRTLRRGRWRKRSHPRCAGDGALVPGPSRHGTRCQMHRC